MILATWNILLQLAPWMLLGMAVAGILHTLFPSDFARRHLGGRGGVSKAVALGVPLPLCSCGVIPAGLGLKKDGASDGAAIGFLISTPQTGVDSILVCASFLGWPFALFKVAAAAVTGWVGGALTEALGGEPTPLGDDVSGAEDPSGARTWRDGVDHGLTLLRTIWGWLALGVVASAAIEVFVPSEAYASLTAHGELVAMLGTLFISLPLYVCATSSVPIAAALVAGGLPPGAALVFLMAGPATNVATIGAILRGFGPRVVGIYLGTIIALSIAGGLAFGSLVGGAAAVAPTHGEHGGWWEVPSAVVLLTLMAWFASQDLMRRLRPAPSHPERIELPVDGMTCGGCVSRLEKLLKAIEGAEDVLVTLQPGRAEVYGAVDAPTVRQVILDAGFRTP